ncbi:hypothetical protein PQR37_33930 [Paraburkholderia nemoris]|uniref:hypothetical protein n=1 Tax=Paraburkholderia nemoris TaxID=2793076 RepID=UPI0038B8E547
MVKGRSSAETTAPANMAALALGSQTAGGVGDIGRIVMALDATRAAATAILDGLEDLGGGISERTKVELTRKVRRRISEQEDSVLQGLVDASPVRLMTPSRAEMEAKAVAAVLDRTTWLTAQMVGKQQNPDATNLHAVTSRWKKEGRVFAIERAGQTLYPRYIFDDLGNPIPAVAEILKVFEGFTPFRIASWFESTNSMLHGKRPREVLATGPLAVIEAARDHVVGAVHG